jgi:hypothetical protein
MKRTAGTVACARFVFTKKEETLATLSITRNPIVAIFFVIFFL